MNAKSIYIISCIACSLFLYFWIPVFGSLKAYATGNGIWLWAWGTWLLPIISVLCIVVYTKHELTKIADHVKSALK